MKEKLNYEDTHKTIKKIEYKLCNRCNEWLPMDNDNFYYNKLNGIDGYHPYCIECAREKAIQWKKDNPEKAKKNNIKHNKINKGRQKEYLREYNQKYRDMGKTKELYRKNPNQYKKYNVFRQEKNHNIYDIEWKNCLKYFNNSCAYCGITLEKHKKIYKKQLHKEHVIVDGKFNLSNCVPACTICNNEKKKMSLNNWYNISNEKYTYERYFKIYLWIRYDHKQFKLPWRRFKGQRLKERIQEIKYLINKT